MVLLVLHLYDPFLLLKVISARTHMQTRTFSHSQAFRDGACLDLTMTVGGKGCSMDQVGKEACWSFVSDC